MVGINSIRVEDKIFSDRAVDGLFGGLAGGALMAVTIVLAGMLVGGTPSRILASFDQGPIPTPQQGVLLHLAVSVVYGIGFSTLTGWLPRRTREVVPGWVVGLIYGAALMALAVGLILPWLGSSLAELPLWILCLGHAVYGITLGLRAYPGA